jgi:hypothetical protein
MCNVLISLFCLRQGFADPHCVCFIRTNVQLQLMSRVASFINVSDSVFFRLWAKSWRRQCVVSWTKCILLFWRHAEVLCVRYGIKEVRDQIAGGRDLSCRMERRELKYALRIWHSVDWTIGNHEDCPVSFLFVVHISSTFYTIVLS